MKVNYFVSITVCNALMSTFCPQIPLLTCKSHGYVDITVDTPAIPSFADVAWVFEDEGDSFAKTRYKLTQYKHSLSNLFFQYKLTMKNIVPDYFLATN